MRTVTRLLISILAVGTHIAVGLDTFAQETSHEHHARDDNRAAEDRERDRWMWQLPEQVLKAAKIRPGMTVADVGAGSGYFTMRLAEKVGETGRVYANEIEQSLLNEIERRCADKGFRNVETVLGDEDDPNLPDSSMDVVLLVNVIHLVDKPVTFMVNIRRDLKSGGSMVLVQWDALKLAAEMPGSDYRTDLKEYIFDDLISRVDSAGFYVTSLEKFLPLQNIIICEPKSGED